MIPTVIKNVNGMPAIVAGGKVVPPMTFCSRHYTNADYIRKMYQGGIRVFFPFTKTEWLEPGAFRKLLETCRFILDCAPEARFIMRVNIDAPKQWCMEHPEEVIQFQDGSLHGQYTYASKGWQNLSGKAIEEFIDNVEGSFIGKRNLGYFFNAGGTEEYYVPKTYDYLALCVGFEKPFREYYKKWLKKRYGTDSALRAAWKRRDARISDPIIPPFEDRVFSRSDREHNAERIDHTLDFGCLPDPDKHQYLSDFYEAWNEASADSLIHFGKVVKRRTKGKQLTGAFYGCFGCVMYHEWGTSSYMKVLRSGAIDFLSAPSNYENRFPPGFSSFTNPIDTLRAHNMIWFNEEDDRTHLAGDVFVRCLDTRTSVSIMKRNCGKLLCEDAQSWWFENTRVPNVDWWYEPELLKTMSRIQRLMKHQYGRNRRKISEIAFVYSQNSVWQTDQETLKDFFQLNRLFEASRIGAPADHIMIEDLDFKEFSKYKVYIFMNPVSLNNRQRRMIGRVVKKNGKVAIWAYAPGVINPEAGKRLSLDHASDLTGIRLKWYPISLEGTYTIVPANLPGAAALDPKKRYGQYEEKVDCLEAFGNAEGTPFRCSRVNPVIVADDPSAVPFATYSYFVRPRGTMTTAIAMKEFPEWTSIYWGPKVLDAEMIRAIAGHFGVHIYNQENDLLYANRDFVCVHAFTAGTKRIRLPKKCEVADAFSDESIASDTCEFSVPMEKGETRLFSLNGRIPR